MEIIWSNDVDPILSVGKSLEDIGVKNWALNGNQALKALDQLMEINTAILGGDVYSINANGAIELTYDNWYCNRKELESYSAFVERSILTAKNYILDYNDKNDSVLFCIVPQTTAFEGHNMRL